MSTQTRAPAPTATTCPACGNGLTLRRNARTQRPFWGCASYPLCAYTRPHTAQSTQLDLPCSLDEAAQLREQLDRLQWRCTDLQEVTAQLEQETTALRAERDTASNEARKLTCEILRLQTVIDATTFLRELQPSQQPAALPSWLDAGLKQILFLAHPDRAGQWQDAASLGTELSVVVNGLRQRLGEVQP